METYSAMSAVWPTPAPAPASAAGLMVQGDEMFDLDLHIVRSGPEDPELTAAATQGDNCVITDLCTHHRLCYQ